MTGQIAIGFDSGNIEGTCAICDSTFSGHQRSRTVCVPCEPLFDGTATGWRRFIPYLMRKQKYRCPICRKPIDAEQPIEVDHIEPQARGGRDHRDNYQATHPRCNRFKSDIHNDHARRFIRHDWR